MDATPKNNSEQTEGSNTSGFNIPPNGGLRKHPKTQATKY